MNRQVTSFIDKAAEKIHLFCRTSSNLRVNAIAKLNWDLDQRNHAGVYECVDSEYSHDPIIILDT